MDNKVLAQLQAYKEAEKDPFFIEDLQKVEKENNKEEIYDRFYTDLEFGTGGIRGIIGAGTNRLNTLVVQRVAEGWAKYLLAQFPSIQPKVVIAYDSRRFSDVFAQIVSEVLTGHNIKVYCYPAPRPTPQLSFSIRILKAQSGLVITASHNPPKYNGLKIYWDDGAQVVSPQDTGIMEEIAKANSITNFAKKTIANAKTEGLYEELGKEYDKKFQDYVASVLVNPHIFKEQSNFSIVYTPLHGTGAYHLEQLMTQYNIKGIIEPSQKAPDGNFPTVKYPNPEESEALNNAIASAKKTGAQLVVATDPDADRVGLAENHNGDYVLLSGNQVGALLLDYILSEKKRLGKLKENSVFINTIVTTNLQEKIASSYNVITYKSFTGFKNIAEAMAKIERDGKHYVFSCEESYGYLASMDVRDKDGISTSMLCIEMAKYYAQKNMTLTNRLEELYKIHGYHKETSINKTLEGATGKEKINAIMEKLRNNPPSQVGSEKVAKIYDYQKKTITSGQGAHLETIEGFSSSSNVLIFVMESGNTLCMRPSGTEPKIKFYFLYSTDSKTETSVAKTEVERLIQEAKNTLEGWLA